MKELWHQAGERLINISGIVAFFLLWEILPDIGVIDAQFIPPFSEVVKAIIKLLGNGELFIHVAASLQRTFLGLIFAIALAIPAGFLLGGVFPNLSRHVRPLLRLLGQINAFSLFPIFILFFGIGEIAKVSIIFWSTIWPVLFTTIAGVQQIDPLYIKSARSVGAGRLTIFTKVLLPGSAPVIFTGIRTGASHAFLMLIAAEMIGASAGLGWVVHNSSMNFVIPRLFAATIVIALLGMAINYFIYWLEENLLEWKR
ncbi:putative membrane protein [Propionispora sp. 2/2-37]|uniref:ABC transporter permease n=1 Tax=Propionispora sp. 2/2-37 TaxID=1677858 RepID=UPI0006BB89C9|nr:ABC transporter permease [Propionispora sp. 2/2-37]CUH97062.1 putative membrane protein [Propionispora sp. 2/2-37]